MSNSLDIDNATLAGLFSSSILYGVFLVLCVGCLHVLLPGWKLERPNWLLVVAAVLMFILNTAVLALSFSRTQDAFIYCDPDALTVEMEGGDKDDIDARVHGLSGHTTHLSLLDRLEKAICADQAAGIALSPEGPDGIFGPSIAPWITAVLAITLFQNLLVTSLIVYRIWKVNSSISGSGGTTVFVWLMTYVATSPSEYVLVDCINPAIGITYCLLVIRVRTKGTPTAPETSGRISGGLTNQSHPMQVISVEVHRQYHTDPSPARDSVSDLGLKDSEQRKTGIYFDESRV
ncbi:hypothetical protein DACRYDRAFT_103875 [Dacryopinax primogenitus]|uniref:Uncharacterized protein n=1 Tax=Dacryopinax primogenitus (strain DJM 731) TaxID=1858805 RepID=M5G9C8_DACPD|nr:uncharacterized protein DACRYDRAFT_103875 [Dacryopinax primogenitus]EJU05389.1 hypothetical protein DACRYDRAFT_103875 [Dacryopinax primogenitus]